MGAGIVEGEALGGLKLLTKTRSNAAVVNNVRVLREDQLLSKAELARRAGVSPLTIDRIEAGKDCRLDTKRKIILGLGMSLAERTKVFAQATSPKRGTR
jgi:DNA-binding XRE family transcriptional regulator